MDLYIIFPTGPRYTTGAVKDNSVHYLAYTLYCKMALLKKSFLLPGLYCCTVLDVW